VEADHFRWRADAKARRQIFRSDVEAGDLGSKEWIEHEKSPEGVKTATLNSLIQWGAALRGEAPPAIVDGLPFGAVKAELFSLLPNACSACRLWVFLPELRVWRCHQRLCPP